MTAGLINPRTITIHFALLLSLVGLVWAGPSGRLVPASGDQAGTGIALVDEAGNAPRRISSEVNSIGTEIEKIVSVARNQANGLTAFDTAIPAIASLAEEVSRLEMLTRRFILGSDTAFRRVA